MLYYSPNLQFLADFEYTLEWKYSYHRGFTELFFATTSLSMIVFGVVILFLSHLMLTFTFVSPWPIVIIVGVAHALSQLVIWVFLLFTSPKNEHATAMGLPQSLQNSTPAASNHAKPATMDKPGPFVQGITNNALVLND